MQRLLLALVLVGMAVAGARAEDGKALMGKVYAAYAGLRSYTQTVSGSVVERIGGQTRGVAGQTAEVHYEKPNRLYVTVTSPQTGTVAAFSNGREMTVYRSRYDTYMKFPAPPTAAEFVKSLGKFGVVAQLDALDFLAGNTADSFVSSYSSPTTAKVNGVVCYVVTGTLKPMRSARSARITYWVDQRSHLIRKLQLEKNGVPTPVRVVRTVKGKQVASVRVILVDNSVTETIQEMQPNPSLSDAAFSYRIPPSATQQDPAKALGQ